MHLHLLHFRYTDWDSVSVNARPNSRWQLGVGHHTTAFADWSISIATVSFDCGHGGHTRAAPLEGIVSGEMRVGDSNAGALVTRNYRDSQIGRVRPRRDGPRLQS